MNNQILVKFGSVATVLFLVFFLITDAVARDRGRGGMSRSGAAASGGFSGRAASGGERVANRGETRQQRSSDRSDTRQSGQEERTERSSGRQEERTERTDDRTDTREEIADELDDDWDGPGDNCCWDDDDNWGVVVAGAAVGAAVGYAAGASSNTTYVTALPCGSPEVVTVDNTSYYRCDSSWYNRTYVDGELNYFLVDAP
jgi:hypothetical protein